MTRDKRSIGIYGLGVSGRASVGYASAQGMQVFCWDDDPRVRAEFSERVGGSRVHFCDFQRDGFHNIDYFIISPGIPWNGQNIDHPVARLVTKAKRAGIQIACDIELLLQQNPWMDKTKLFAISGTNGKTSVVSWLEAVSGFLKQSALALGNNGSAALEASIDYQNYFFELSSYQLDLIHTPRFDKALLLNISPDHLDRYGSMEAYRDSKAKIQKLLKSQRAPMIHSMDDPYSRQLSNQAEKCGQSVVRFSVENTCKGGIYLQEGQIIDDRYGDAVPVITIRDYPVLNCLQHGRNLVAVYAMLVDCILPGDPRKAKALFLPAVLHAVDNLRFDHRQNPIARLKNTLFVDDSKATNPIAAKDALSQFDRVHWIAGGKAKDGGFEALGSQFSELKGCYLIGEAEEEIQQYLLRQALPDGVSPICCGTLEGALSRVANNLSLKNKECVLFSPGCASFDQYQNYVHRGKMFEKNIITQWPAVEILEKPTQADELLKGCRHGI